MWYLLGSALAGEPTIGGVVRPEVAFDPIRDYELEDWLDVNTFARVWAAGDLGHDAWFLEARLQHHLVVGEDAEAWWELGLGESGWSGKIGGPVDLRIGALVERWGKLDLLPVADVLNPRDLRSGLLAPGEWQRLPIPMAVLAVSGGAVRAETVLIPFASADKLWLREMDWSYVRQGMTSDQIIEMRGWEGETNLVLRDTLNGALASIEEMSPSMRRGLDATVNGNNLPEAFFYNGEIAERVEISARNVDVGVMGGYLRSRQAQAALEPDLADILRTETLPDNNELTAVQAKLVGGPLIIDWPRTIVAGADGSALVGPVQLRFDTLWRSARVVRQAYGGADTAPELGAGLGFDYVRGSSFQVTAEVRWLHLFDPPRELMFALADQVQVAGGVRFTFAADRVTLQLGGAYDVTYAEWLARPSVGWRASDHVLFEVGGLILAGSTPAPETLADSLTYSGGPLSYWQQNDSVTFAVSFIK